MTFSNDIDIKDILKLFDFNIDNSTEIIANKIIDNIKTIHLKKKLIPTYCPSCNTRMHSKGIYKRLVKHPILQDSTLLKLIVHQLRWCCPYCNLSMNDIFPFLEANKQSTNLNTLYGFKCQQRFKTYY